ncbi:MAG: TM2 domain-containing protein [Clostridia bacterium]|nr:TM2 domain-containing protein [Clostridia bacterium]
MDENFNCTEPCTKTEAEQPPVSQKSRTAALILAIVVGSMGINRFYLGIKGGTTRLVRYIIAMTMSGVVFGIFFVVMAMSQGIADIYYYDSGSIITTLLTLIAVDYAALAVMIGMLVPNTIGAVKDIVRTAKGTITDGQGLPVTQW